MENLSVKILRMVRAKRAPNDQQLMGWSEDALDLENACRYWKKAYGLLRSKIREGRHLNPRSEIGAKQVAS